jgi:hypothetical protein
LTTVRRSDHSLSIRDLALLTLILAIVCGILAPLVRGAPFKQLVLAIAIGGDVIVAMLAATFMGVLTKRAQRIAGPLVACLPYAPRVRTPFQCLYGSLAIGLALLSVFQSRAWVTHKDFGLGATALVLYVHWISMAPTVTMFWVSRMRPLEFRERGLVSTGTAILPWPRITNWSLNEDELHLFHKSRFFGTHIVHRIAVVAPILER